MNIVYGGSFNPPTKAHLEIVTKLLNTFEDSQVIVLPVGNNYHKKTLQSFNDRFNMLKLQFNDNKRVIISSLENNEHYLGTYEALNTLSNDYDDLYLVIGSDNLYEFDKWINYKRLLTDYSLLIFKRDNDDVESLMKRFKEYNPKFKVIEFNNSINSTMIRSDIKKYNKWLTKEVYKYIIDNKLYEVDEDVL